MAFLKQYTEEVRTLIQQELAKIEAGAKKVEGEIVHVAQSDFDSLVARVEELEKKAEQKVALLPSVFANEMKTLGAGARSVISDATGVVAVVEKDAAGVVTEVKADVEKL